MKTLYIMRHGEAHASPLGDALRELSPNGEREAACSAQWIAAQVHERPEVYASPLRRAQQTAAIVCDAMQLPLNGTEAFLLPEASVSLCCDWINTLQAQEIVIVSHMPMVSLIAQRLCGEMQGFKTAGVLQLQWNAQRWIVTASFRPPAAEPA